MIDSLPALQVIIPLIAAPLCVLLHHGKLAWLLTTVVSWVCWVISWGLLQSTLADGPLSYAMGGWAAPYGIEYRIDEINAFVLFIVSGASAWLLLFARQSVEHEVGADRRYLFYTLWLLNLTGLLGITSTADVFNLFVFLEVSSLSTYAMVSFGNQRHVLLAAFRYLIIGTIGATFILIGIGLLYMMTGTLNMADLSDRLPALAGNRTVQAAVGFFAVGIAIKMALFPLHAWLPGAYTHAPSVVSAYLAATATKVGVYVWLRMFFSVCGMELSFNTLMLDRIVLPLALAGIVVASLVAVYQSNIKRMLAFSSVAQIGYMVLGISFLSVLGLSSAMVHLFNHALMKAVLFMAMGCVFFRVGAVDLDSIRGVGRHMPWTMAAFVVGGFSLVGVPMTAGFISKWLLLSAALEADSHLIAFLVVATSLIALVYVWRVVDTALLQAPVDETVTVKEAPLGMLIPLWVLVGANIYFGIRTELTVDVARQAARTLLGD